MTFPFNSTFNYPYRSFMFPKMFSNEHVSAQEIVRLMNNMASHCVSFDSKE